MKKILLLVLFLSAVLSNAQFVENFNSTSQTSFPPAGWLVTDNGVGDLMWQSNLGTPFLNGINETPCAYINRQNIGLGNTSLDWLITPQITVNQGDNLFFTVRQSMAGYQNSYFAVLVSTTSQSDLNSFVPIANYAEDELNPDDYQQSADLIGIALDDYEGQQIYIAFRRSIFQAGLAMTGERFLLDDVAVGQTPVTPGFYLQGNVTYEPTGDCAIGTPRKYTRLLAVSDLETKIIYTDLDGNYPGFYIAGNTVTISVMDLNPNAFSVSPSSQSFTYGTGDPISVTNFCISKVSDVTDVAIEILPTQYPPVPGIFSSFLIVYRNKGSVPVSGSIDLSFDGQYYDLSSSGVPQSETANSMTWTFSNLQPMEYRHITMYMYCNSPTDTPPLNIGDILTFSGNITVNEGDSDLSDNTFNLSQTVAGSYDPNDKTVLEGAQIATSQTGNYLHYVIRFQNTGTAEAHRIVVRDFLDTKLDINSLEILDASHDVHTSIFGRLAEFLFDDIMLPAVSQDEAASHGYIACRIKPLPGFTLGQSVYNTANIYFDYNFPIVTNTVETTVVELGTPDFLRDAAVLYPNPAKDEFSVSAQNTIERIGIYSLSGQLLLEQKPQSGSSASVKIGGLASGTYLVRIEGEDFRSTKKLFVN